MDPQEDIPLRREDLLAHPVDQFARWWEQAKTFPGATRPEPVCLSTIGPDGWPDSRMVLLKTFDYDGFVFFTNMHSPKARSLVALPRAALCFYWEAPRRQVRIQGTAQRVAEDEVDAYWITRPRESQIGAWASDQSAVVPDAVGFERRAEELTQAFEGRPIPRPPHWSGFRVLPRRVEFWQERSGRLHDRFVYVPAEDEPDRWVIRQLYP
jgi:pyridoxamine 5'-phosphate oxidase